MKKIRIVETVKQEFIETKDGVVKNSEVVNSVVQIICDDCKGDDDEREEIAHFLLEKGFQMSDGFLGDQEDFSICSESSKDGYMFYILLQKNQEQQLKLIKTKFKLK